MDERRIEALEESLYRMCEPRRRITRSIERDADGAIRKMTVTEEDIPPDPRALKFVLDNARRERKGTESERTE